MVTLKVVRASNARVNDGSSPRVAVFAGGTSGIGKFTIKALVATGTSIRIYLVGRASAERRMDAFIKELLIINPKAEVIWTEAEISLLADTKRVCEVIKSKEARIDLLFLSAGYAPMTARQETIEGLEVAQSLEYYSRMLFILQLSSRLRAAEHPRVISVLGGGLERWTPDVDDLDLKKPGNFSGAKAQMQYLTMNTMALDRLAADDANVTFIHSWPGMVSTGNIQRSFGSSSILGWLAWLILEPIFSLFGFSEEECGQRYLFQSTSAAFGGRGVPWEGKPGVNTQQGRVGGLYLVDKKCNCTPNAKTVARIREQARDKIWDHTQEVLRPYT